jgi:hypothetical protein
MSETNLKAAMAARDTANAERLAAEAAVKRLEGQRADIAIDISEAETRMQAASAALIETGDEASAKSFHDATTALAPLRLRADAYDRGVLREARQKLGVAIAAEEEAGKVVDYRSAEEDAAAAVKMFEMEYPRLIDGLRSLQSRSAEATQRMFAVNSRLPAGFSPLPDPEAIARDAPALPRRIVKEEEVVCWVYAHTTNVIAPEQVPLVQVITPDSGALRPGSAGGALVQVHRRRMKRVEYRRPMTYRQGARIHQMDLPALRVDVADVPAIDPIVVEHLPIS